MELAFKITLGAFKTVKNLAVIVVPLMILMQLARDYKLMERMLGLFSPVSRLLGMSRRAALPLLVGLAFGLAYGAGVIIQVSEEEGLSFKDRFLVVLFLVACHAVVEDTMVFVAVGANGWLLLLSRLSVAVAVTALCARFLPLGAFRVREDEGR
ncbi:nucleoside/Fe2+ transporter [Thermanaerovibrio velox DSM 12556]|uniref:Nucleoside/Fe2+ transporter n=1 Tax=Thermanaerovibrio velox DSM 12556 TaxID=926567 RepID=H0UQM8_9BACT|nr:nucleoside recognition domain-containing protein [Thermanaerovibrio velox]EHM10792.1 nucleoside/Fe2+ transporter [Thermanaerovibrio velox DSM 12556]